MKPVLFGGLALVLVGFFGASPALAEAVPEDARGIWSNTDCGDMAGKTLIFNSDAVLVFDKPHGSVSGQPFSRGVRMGIGPVKARAGALVLARPDMARQILPPLRSLTRCEHVPFGLTTLYAEAITQFRSWDRIAGRCRKGRTVRCMMAIEDFIDVSDDDAFSPAELKRIFRGTGLFLAYELALAQRARQGGQEGDSFLIEAAPLQAGVVFAGILGVR